MENGNRMNDCIRGKWVDIKLKRNKIGSNVFGTYSIVEEEFYILPFITHSNNIVERWNIPYVATRYCRS